MLLSRSTQEGEIEKQEQEMLYKVFDFADKEVSAVMVPRPEVVALSVDLPPEECLAAVIDSPYTRYPVYRGSPDTVLGILHVRDLFSALVDRGIANVHVADLVRPAHFVPETKDLAAMLTEFRRTNQHLAIVVDEYGSMAGIVTLEDLLEEIVGEIEDEFDLPDESIEHVDDDTIRIDGTFPIDDFNEQFATRIPIEDYHSMGGFVFGLLGRAAEPGDSVDYDGLRFDVLEVEGQRIHRLAVTFVERRDSPKEVRSRANKGDHILTASHRPRFPDSGHRRGPGRAAPGGAAVGSVDVLRASDARHEAAGQTELLTIADLLGTARTQAAAAGCAAVSPASRSRSQARIVGQQIASRAAARSSGPHRHESGGNPRRFAGGVAVDKTSRARTSGCGATCGATSSTSAPTT
jgi:Mg2+/Co2+ transporter CorC